MELSGLDTLPQQGQGDAPETLGGRYVIEALLGAGGMGSVYRVRDVELDEVVALKIVGALEPDALARFRAEVKLARRVTHANVARTFDIGEHGGVRFLTMEYVPGESLRRILMREQLDEADARFLAEAICDGCIAIHEADVVHGDLKPENIVVAPTGLVKVTDFGLAAVRDSDRAYGGTPGYMAPEQDLGAPADQRADLYSLGVILHELFAGRRPAGELSDRLPRDVRAVVLRCLDRDPARRPATAREVRAAIATTSPPRRLTAPVRAQPAALTVAVRGLHAEEPGDAELALALARDLAQALPDAPLASCDAIVEGTLRRTGPRLHLSLRLLSRRESYVIWARTSTIDESEAAGTIADFARVIAHALDAKASQPHALRDPRLIESYLKARALDEQMFHDHTADNVEMYRSLLEHSPADPLIQAGHARALVQRGLREVGALDDATLACEQAIAVAPELGEAHLSLGLRLFIGNDCEGAVRALVRGIELAPSLGWGHSLFGRVLSEVGLLERGLARSELALSLDPSSIAWANVVRYADLAGHDARVAQLLAGPPPFAHDGDNWMYWVTRAQRAVGKGRGEAEVVAADLAASRSGQSPLLSPLIDALRGSLSAPALRAVFSPFLDGDPANHRARSSALGFGAELAIHLGYHAEARDYVEESVREGTCDVTWIDRCHSFDHLRGESWFAACRDKVEARAERVRAAVPSE